ncbi:MAG: hypothetical protein GX963_00185 [Bacteroidales bacterium]|mgnify:CR=1 FL=1|nr:hypothetical protein [Bacteroidales bacterium]
MNSPIKSWASSLLFIDSKGWYSQVAVTLNYEEQTIRIASVKKETPYTHWLHSGVLLLSSQQVTENVLEDVVFINKELLLSELPIILPLTSYSLYFCTPFDFIHKQPVAETRHKLLQ